MGSSAIMDDSTRYRGRSTLVQVPSGGDDDPNNNTTNPVNGDPSKRQRRSKPATRPKHRRRLASQKDTPFWKLVLQVGATLLVVCLALSWLFRYLFPHAGMVEELVYVVDDSIQDDDARLNAAKEQQQQQHAEDLDQGEDWKDNLISQPKSSQDAEEQEQDGRHDRHHVEKDESSSSVIYTPEDEAKLSLLMKQQKQVREQADAVAAAIKATKTKPPLPSFQLSDAAAWDAFGILERLGVEDATNTSTVASGPGSAIATSVESTNATTTTTTSTKVMATGKSSDNNATSASTTSNTTTTTPTFWQVSQNMRNQFSEIYGNENIARMLIDKGLTTFFTSTTAAAAATTPISSNADDASTVMTPPLPPEDIVATACRLQQARQQQRPFRMAFGGYSVTAGRGNKFKQSFPFQMRRLLRPVFEMAGIPELQVINAAIGGCPAFPYGWCMTNFWGGGGSVGSPPQPDVVSWDYSMNEAGGVPEGLEAYIRHLLATYNDPDGTIMSPPKLIVKDTYLASQRRDVLGAYAHLLKDPVVLHTGPAVKPFLERQPEDNPPGFQDWRKFGAPIGAPGQALHHPALKEHELMGWMLAMHFLTALEYLQVATTANENGLDCSNHQQTSVPPLPPPVTGSNATNYPGILFGRATTSSNQRDEWSMNPVHCRTTFQPIVSGDLTELVVSGTTAEDLDVALPKSQMYYNEGWTLDLSEEEKQSKRKLSLYPNELGFIDSKEAYYGIYESPTMQLLIPYEKSGAEGISTNSRPYPQVGQLASDWFESVVLCQVNEKRTADGACNMGSDLRVTIGGVNVPSTTVMKETGTLYLGKPVCLQLGIPVNATLTSHNTLAGNSNQHTGRDQVGISVGIKVVNPHIAHVNQACSVSHVVWEQRKEAQIDSQIVDTA